MGKKPRGVSGTVGMSKHRKSGRSPVGPRERLRRQMEADREEKQSKPKTTKWYSSVKETLASRRKR
jgi:hypothetical protein